MDNFMNRMEIGYFNIVNANNTACKEKILNKLLYFIVNEYKITDSINYLYSINTQDFIKNSVIHNKQHLLLFIRDCEVISNALKLKDNEILEYKDNAFVIKIVIPPESESEESSPLSMGNIEDYKNIEWGSFDK